MMTNTDERLYTASHEWIVKHGESLMVGITDYGQEQLGEIVFIELPQVGARIKQDGVLVVVESVKAASEIVAPFAGTVIDVNRTAVDRPQIVNTSPLADGWLCTIKPDADTWSDALLTRDQYQQIIDVS